MIAASDLAELDACAALITAVEEELGPVDILIANAGIVTSPTGILDIAVED
jgi:NAD(P)-dependent dehydrogenase (short-subunit alcohol dehydrogenase family)